MVVGAAILAHYLVRDFRGQWFLRFLILLPWAAPVALGDDHLAVDLRLALQRRELDARGDRTCSASSAAVRRRRLRAEPAAVARPAEARDGSRSSSCRRGACCRSPSSSSSPAARRSRTRSRTPRRSTARPASGSLVRHAAAAAADRARRRAVRDRLHRDGHGGRLHPHARRPVQLDAGADDLGRTDGIESGSLGEGAAISLFLLPVLAVVTIAMLFFARRARGRVMGSSARDAGEGGTCVVLAPFAIVLAFPFYWMLTTALKNRSRPLQPQNPTVLVRQGTGPTSGHNVQHSLPVQAHGVPALAREHRDRRRPSSRSRSCSRCPPATRSRGCPAAGARALGVGHLPRLPRPADAALPAALAPRRRARAARLALVADPRLPVLHGPVRDVAADGLLQDDPAGARGRGAGRRLLATSGAARASSSRSRCRGS